jgi:hypothetical protein
VLDLIQSRVARQLQGLGGSHTHLCRKGAKREGSRQKWKEARDGKGSKGAGRRALLRLFASAQSKVVL